MWTRLSLIATALAGAVFAIPAAGATQIAVVGDPGLASAGEAAVASMVAGWAPDAVVLTGDNYYASVGGTGTDRYDRSIGRYYCGFLRDVSTGTYCAGGTAASNRLWPALGNHDYSDAGIANYLAYFSLPGNERYYDVRVGPVHLFMLDSDEMLRSSEEMAVEKAWLEAGLRASSAPHQVVVFHHPPYTSSARGPYASLRWPFGEWGADLVLNGHDHIYERLGAGGITYVVNGIGGASLTGFPATFASESIARWSGSFGAMRITASDASLSGEFVTTDGVVRDVLPVPESGPPTGAGPGSGDATGHPVEDVPAAVWPAMSPAVTPAVSPARVRLVTGRRAVVSVGVALTGSAPSGATVRVASTVSLRGRVVGRGVVTSRVGADGSLPASMTLTVRLGRAVRLRARQRVTVRSAVTVIPVGGRATTSRVTTIARVR